MRVIKWGVIATLTTLHVLASAIECPVKGPEFLKAATESMWTVVEARVLSGDGGCSLVGNSVLSSGAKTGDGVTCEIAYFRGGKLKAPWKFERIQFAGADVKFPAPSPNSDSGALVVVQTRAEREASSSLNVVGVTLSTSESDCRNWRGALVGGPK